MKIAALDIETSGLDPNKDCIHSIAICTERPALAGGVITTEEVIDISRYGGIGYVKHRMEQLANEFDVVIAHAAKFDTSFIYTHYGVEFKNLHCTLLGSQILLNNHKYAGHKHNLKQTIQTFLKKDVIDTTHKELMRQRYMNHPKGDQIDKEMEAYVLEDTLHLIPLYREQMRRIKLTQMQNVMKLENRLIPVIMKMEVVGCLIDKDSWMKVTSGWEEKQLAARDEMDGMVKHLVDTLPQLAGSKLGRERLDIRVFQSDFFGAAKEIVHRSDSDINFASAHQIKKLLLQIDNIEVDSIDEKNIELLVTEHPKAHMNPLLTKLLEYREYTKLLSTYGKSFLDKVDEHNYIHTNFSQCRTRTGRLSSSGPNLQNIPSRGDGKILRDFFVPAKGNKFVTCDHNGAEVSLAADFSGEPLLMNSLLKGVDMHSELASVSFRIIFDDPEFTVSDSEEPVCVQDHMIVPNELRTIHKSVTFAKFYKAGSTTIYQTLAKYINMFHDPRDRMDIATKCSKALDKKMPVLTKFLDGMVLKANQNGFLKGKFGRMRWMKDKVYGEAANYPIQNANAEAIKIAMINVDKYLEELGQGRLVMNIHDEVVVEVPDEYAEEVAPRIAEIMGEGLSYFMTRLKGGATSKIDTKWLK